MLDTPAGRLGLGICYDLRFPEMAALYGARGAQVLVYPGAGAGAGGGRGGRRGRDVHFVWG